MSDLQFEEIKDAEKCKFIDAFKERYLVLKDQKGLAQCLDFPEMVKTLLSAIERKLKENEKITVADLVGSKTNEEKHINKMVTDAKGCFEKCLFCGRKCELPPHNVNDTQHNCEKRGH